ncbi:MAG: hypothetical protein IIZ83_07140 [Oscillospiraceae bacterium]|nr:hypothetical protein [Oscillospiraceae bacterium]
MGAIRKTRIDAWESKLSDEERTRLYVETSGLSYQAAKLVAQEKLKVKLPAQSTFYRFLERMREEDSALRLAKASASSKEVGLMAAKNGIADIDLVKSFQSMAATAALDGDSEKAARFINMACSVAHAAAKGRELEIAQEKLKLLQAKEAKLIKAVVDDKLTDEDRVRKVKSIFGIR